MCLEFNKAVSDYAETQERIELMQSHFSSRWVPTDGDDGTAKQVSVFSAHQAWARVMSC